MEVAPHNTSTICSACSYKSSDNRVSQEVLCCVACSYEENADTNAAKTILEKAVGATTPNALKDENPDKNPPL